LIPLQPVPYEIREGSLSISEKRRCSRRRRKAAFPISGMIWWYHRFLIEVSG